MIQGVGEDYTGYVLIPDIKYLSMVGEACPGTNLPQIWRDDCNSLSPSASIPLFALNCRCFKLLLQGRCRPLGWVRYSASAVRRARCADIPPQEHREFGKAVSYKLTCHLTI